MMSLQHPLLSLFLVWRSPGAPLSAVVVLIFGVFFSFFTSESYLSGGEGNVVPLHLTHDVVGVHI